MQPLPEAATHPASLRRLLGRFRDEADTLARELDQIADDVAAIELELARQRLSGNRDIEALRSQCADLQELHDHVACELAHAQLAIAGAAAELDRRLDPALAG